jgi:hypothetical protein
MHHLLTSSPKVAGTVKLKLILEGVAPNLDIFTLLKHI